MSRPMQGIRLLYLRIRQLPDGWSARYTASFQVVQHGGAMDPELGGHLRHGVSGLVGQRQFIDLCWGESGLWLLCTLNHLLRLIEI